MLPKRTIFTAFLVLATSLAISGQCGPASFGLLKVANAAPVDPKISDAEGNYNREVTTAEARYGKDCVEELAPLEGLRAFYYKTKQTQKCQQVAEHILRIADKRLPPTDARVETAVSNLIGVECLNGVCKDDTGLLDRLLAIRLKRYGPDAPVTITARQMAAEAMLHHRNFKGSAALYKQNVESYQRTHSPLTTSATIQYSLALHRGGQDEAAFKELQPLVAQPPSDKQRFIGLLSVYGDVCLALKKRSEAEHAYATMAAEARRTFGEKSDMTANYLVRYSEFLKKIGRTQQAHDLDKSIASIYKR